MALPIGQWIPSSCTLQTINCPNPTHYNYDNQQLHSNFNVSVIKSDGNSVEFRILHFFKKQVNTLKECFDGEPGIRNVETIQQLCNSGKVKYAPGLTTEKIKEVCGDLGWAVAVEIKASLTDKIFKTSHSDIVNPFNRGNREEFLQAIQKGLKIDPAASQENIRVVNDLGIADKYIHLKLP